MKKIIFTLLLLIIISSTYIHAQNYSRYTEASEAYTTIIRSYPLIDHAEVAYTFDETSGYIELRNNGAITGRIPVPLDYIVKDMKIYHNLLYFCGEHQSVSQGFIAVTNLYEIFSYISAPYFPPPTTLISYTDIWVEPYKYFITSLEKLVVYKDEDDPLPTDYLNFANEHIVAIGRNRDNPTYPEWMTVHIKYNDLLVSTGFTPIPYSIDIEVIYDKTSPYNEQIQEVLLTDNYVTLVSYRYSTDEYILHRCDKYNIVGTYNTIHKFAAPQYEALSLIKGVAMEDNHIALASLAAKDPNNGTFEIRIRNIYLTTMSMTNSQALSLGVQKHDVEMAYDISKRKIILMMYYLFTGNQYDMHTFIEIDPWTNSSYNPAAMYDLTLTRYNSIYHSNDSYFIAAAGYSWFRKALPMAVPPNDCFNQDHLYVNPIPDTNQVLNPIVSEDKKGTPFSTMPTVPIEMVFITKDCSTYE